MSPDQSADASETDDERILRPSIRPVLISLFVALLGTAVVAAGVVALNLEGSGQGTLLGLLGVIAGLLILRQFVTLFVLTRTRYVITPGQLRREFSLLYRHRTRELPLSQLRGVELRRDPGQTLLGYGDLRFLTAGTNQSLGFLTFEQIPNPVDHRDALREALELDQ